MSSSHKHSTSGITATAGDVDAAIKALADRVTKLEAAQAPAPVPSLYTFEDTFEGTALSPRWGHHYTCCPGGPMAAIAYVKDGLLHLPVRKRPDGMYDRDLIDTRDSFKQQYGRFEARISVPKGGGLWPAFWLYDGVFGTDGDEIDIVELLGKEGMVAAHQTVHKGTMANQTYAPWNSVIPPTGSWADGTFHVYAVDWRADHIAFLIDGKETWRETTHLISKPLAILLNMGLGGWAGAADATTPATSEMLVDWVRVSK